MAKQVMEDVIPASYLIGACGLLLAVAFLVCCSKRRSASRTLRTVTFDCRPDSTTGVARDAVVLQFIDGTTFSHRLYTDNTDLCLSQECSEGAHQELVIPGFGSVNQQQRCIEWKDPIPPFKFASRQGYGQYGGEMLDPTALMDSEEQTLIKSMGYEDIYSTSEMFERNQVSGTTVSPVKVLSNFSHDSNNSEQPRRGKGKLAAAFGLDGPFGPNDTIQSSHDREKDDGPLYHILEEESYNTDRFGQPQPGSVVQTISVPDNYSSAPYQISPTKPSLQPRPQQKPPLGIEERTVVRRCYKDYEEIDDSAVTDRGCPKGATANVTPISEPGGGSRGRLENPDTANAGAKFHPWPGCPQKVLLMSPSNGRIVAQEEKDKTDSGVQESLDSLNALPDGTVRRKLNMAYSNHKIKKAKRADYRPVLTVPSEKRSDFDYDYTWSHFQKTKPSRKPLQEGPVGQKAGQPTRSRRGPGSIQETQAPSPEKQTGAIPKRGSSYDHISRQATAPVAEGGGGVYSRCHPDEESQSVTDSQYSQTTPPRTPGKALGGRGKPNTNKQKPSLKPAEEEVDTHRGITFYDRLARPNFKGGRPIESSQYEDL